MTPWDYLCIGHITRDILEEGDLLGGTAAYSGHVARTLGCKTAVLTSCAPAFSGLQKMTGLSVNNVPASETSTFENVYHNNERVQTLHARALTLQAKHLPAGWETSLIVHFGPVCNEIDSDMIERFPNSLIGMTPQGWMRRWDERGHVFTAEWALAEQTLPAADVVILSAEDIHDRQMLQEMIALSKLLIMTENVAGCKLFMNGEVTQVPAPSVPLVEPTGAGDIFAAAFLVEYMRNGREPFQAAHFANFIAAHSITQTGLPAKMDLLTDLLQQKAK